MDDEIRKEYFAQTSLQYSQLTGENFAAAAPHSPKIGKKVFVFLCFCDSKVLIMSTKLFDVCNGDVTIFSEL